MATSNLPTPTLQPVATTPDTADEKPALQILDQGASCCGGGACSID
ncbi:hypothetical protein ACIGEP_03515 [Microbacterium sp. NPDC077663]